MNARKVDRGFSLIELMVVITILALLAVLGIPSFRDWVLNTRIRTTSEGLENGLRNARVQAIQKDTKIRFEMTGSTSASWTICKPLVASPTTCAGGATVQTYVSDAGKSTVLIGSSTTAATPFATGITAFGTNGVTFNPLGRPEVISYLRLDVYSTRPNARRLVTTVSANGQVRTCDPQLAQATSPQGC